ncbi:S66 peptidase family protein [Chryseosolibacter indicus]|uniref:LD-carboxypeptidase n=1 Tax=Chryseosolibacter indicus TaxID=2782351 RepID=A0ABS5VY69_9BACT|nr:LD-carboxypeptidase [Chryseosolibacter indicus]MBT1706013.1 LD-carboxypeptidase [Chryseosolibacter indicus]
MINPPPLKPGDRIAIVAPARKVSLSDLTSAIDTFSSWGLDVAISENVKSEAHAYLAGTDQERLEGFQDLIDDPSVKAIIAARGGYGSTRILDSLDFSSFKKSPKWIIGFSDITAIHLKLLQLGCKSVHGTMPILFSQPNARTSVESLKNLLFNNSFEIKCDPSSRNRLGSADGVLVGGNLSLVVDSLGTSSEINTNGCVLLIEEIDEYIYRMDRMMTQLKRAGKLEQLNGLIVGHMTDMKESTLAFKEDVEQIILNAVKDFYFPVAFNFPSGHENPNFAWIHGEKVILNVGQKEVSLKSESI